MKPQFKFNKLVLFIFPVFLISLAEAIMSYVFPILVEEYTHSNTLMGIIVALSSIAGMVMDFTLPKIIGKKTWRFQLITACLISLGFPFFTILGATFSLVMFFLLASLTWGIFYEFFAFAIQSFIVEEESRSEFSKDWGIVFAMINLPAIIAPVIGSTLLHESSMASLNFSLITLVLAVIFTILLLLNTKRPKEVVIVDKFISSFNLLSEFKYWEILSKNVFPLILMSLLLKFIEATFWNLGGLFGTILTNNNGNDWIVVLSYNVPLIIGAFILVKLNISKRKKFLSQVLLLLSGIFLTLISTANGSISIIIILILISSIFISFSGPLNESVLSDLLERMGKKKVHLLAIVKFSATTGYVISTILMGILADSTNYFTVFSAIGIVTVVISLFLLLITPRKLKIPQTQLASMDS